MSEQNSSKYSEKMISLMIEALGGEAQVDKILKQKSLTAVIKPGATIGSVCDQAKEEGWLETFRAMTFGEIAGLLGGKGAAQKRSGGRMTQAEVAELRTKIVDFLKGHPGSKVGDIAAFAGADTVKVAVQLRNLIKDGVAKSEGQKAKTVYSHA
jgi:hypothetical protein